MLESRISANDDEFCEGIRLLENGEHDRAEAYFQQRLDRDNPLVYYGLATARFKRDQISLTRDQTLELIDLYKKSMSKKPDFADSYLMCAMAYEQLASVLTREYKREPYDNQDKKIADIKSTLEEEKNLMDEAVRLNPGFQEIAESEIKAYENRINSLDYLKEYYNASRHLFN